MASGSTPDATLQDLPKVETDNQPHVQAHDQVQDQQQSQTKVRSEVQSNEDPQHQLEAQAEAPPHPQLHAEQVQEHSQPKVQPTDEPQVQSQDQPKDTLQVKPQDQQKDQEEARLHHQNKEQQTVQQTDQQDAQPQAKSQAQPSSKPHAQQQVLVAPTPVVKEKTFGVAVLEILAIAIAIALFFVVLAVVFKRHRFVAVAGSDRAMCPSTACDRLAGALISSLQRESNPCDDFYAYVCGRYTGMHSTGDVFSDMEAELWRLVKDKVITGADLSYALPTVTTTPPPSHPSILNKIQALFAACLRPPVNDSTAPLKAFVDSQGLGFSGNASAIDAVLTMLRLSYLYDVQSVLGARFLAFKPHPRNLLLRASVNRRYVQWLGEKPENVSFSYQVLLDVYDRVEHVDGVVPRILDTEKAVRRLANAAAKGNATPLELIMEDKDIRYYGNGAVTTLLSNLRSSLPAETLHLLVSWDTVRTMAPLVSPATVPGEGGTRYNRCWRLVQRSLGVPAVAAYLLDKLVPNATEALQTMTKGLRATYNALLSNEAFIWHSVPKSTLAEFQELQATSLFFASGVRSKQQLDAFYEAYPYTRKDDSFLDTWLKVCRLADETQRNASGLDLGTLLTPNALTLAAAASNKILLPAPTLLLPLFSPEALASTNFGGLGHILAHGMLRKLHKALTEAGEHNGSSVLERYKRHLECVQPSPINGSSSSAPGAGGVANVDWTTGIVSVADLVGLHVSYETFSTRLQRRTLPSTNMTERQVFFATSCFKFCRMEAEKGRQPVTQAGGQDPASRILTVSRERCNAPLRNLKAFADAFKCKPTSPMNPARKCTFW